MTACDGERLRCGGYWGVSEICELHSGLLTSRPMHYTRSMPPDTINSNTTLSFHS